ncbi:MAG: hypothetical protein QME96_15530 [Myxococcota bacterium]|nr:hypothetical protein [Myxococcota bacterium]
MTDTGTHKPMSPDEIDGLCEHLNPGRTVGDTMRGLPSMVVLTDIEAWTGLDNVKPVFLPADADDDTMVSYDNGQHADHIVSELAFTPPSGVFELHRLVRELPMHVLEAYRLAAGRKPEGG